MVFGVKPVTVRLFPTPMESPATGAAKGATPMARSNTVSVDVQDKTASEVETNPAANAVGAGHAGGGAHVTVAYQPAS